MLKSEIFSLWPKDWVEAKSIEVEEGGRVLITSHHLQVTVDFVKYGIPESAVLFHVAERPAHGKLDVSVWSKPDDNIFTLLDLNTDKVIEIMKILIQQA